MTADKEHPIRAGATGASIRAAPSPVRAYRLSSIDMLRGVVIVIMALDHVRDYFMTGSQQDPMTDPHTGPLLFATRWITHLCAPVFVLLAGTSAGLMAERRAPRALGTFLLSRGLWLIAVEWFVISTAWTFAPLGLAQLQGRILVPLQVIWAIGASMVVLAGAQFLGRRACLVIGLVIVLGHNLLDGLWPKSGLFDVVALRALDLYGDPHGWSVHAGEPAATVMAFLNTTKYPPSLLFLLMTLGPAALLTSYAERLRGVLKDTLVVFGWVPFAFYVAHLSLIHGLSLLLGAILGVEVSRLLTIGGLYPKVGYGLPLVGVYAVWALVVALLYPFCRWMAHLKARRSDWWLSYL